jgi:hypothetical protein
MSDEEETFDDGDMSGGEEYAELVGPLSYPATGTRRQKLTKSRILTRRIMLLWML